MGGPGSGRRKGGKTKKGTVADKSYDKAKEKAQNMKIRISKGYKPKSVKVKI